MKYHGSSHDSELAELAQAERELGLRKRVTPPSILPMLGIGICFAGVIVIWALAR